jgi:hypothetical protein
MLSHSIPSRRPSVGRHRRPPRSAQPSRSRPHGRSPVSAKTSQWGRGAGPDTCGRGVDRPGAVLCRRSQDVMQVNGNFRFCVKGCPILTPATLAFVRIIVYPQSIPRSEPLRSLRGHRGSVHADRSTTGSCRRLCKTKGARRGFPFCVIRCDIRGGATPAVVPIIAHPSATRFRGGAVDWIRVAGGVGGPAKLEAGPHLGQPRTVEPPGKLRRVRFSTRRPGRRGRTPQARVRWLYHGPEGRHERETHRAVAGFPCTQDLAVVRPRYSGAVGRSTGPTLVGTGRSAANPPGGAEDGPPISRAAEPAREANGCHFPFCVALCLISRSGDRTGALPGAGRACPASHPG